MSTHSLREALRAGELPCEWCGQPAVTLDTDGDPACAAHVSEERAREIRARRRTAEIRAFIAEESRRP